MDLTTAYQQAALQAGTIVAGVSSDQLTLPTPCTEFDVHALVNHMVGGLYMFDAAARAASIEMSALEHDFVADGMTDSYNKASAQLQEALGAEGVIMGKWEMPFGTMPGMIAIGIGIIESVQHGWDLAKATGQSAAFDNELLEICMRTAKMMPVEQSRNPRVFGPEQPAPDGATLADELAAFLGRTV